MADPIPFPVNRRRRTAVAQVAKHYYLDSAVAGSRLSPEFLHKAAIFQEIRDSLAEAEAGLISGGDAEARIVYFTKLYLYGVQAD